MLSTIKRASDLCALGSKHQIATLRDRILSGLTIAGSIDTGHISQKRNCVLGILISQDFSRKYLTRLGFPGHAPVLQGHYWAAAVGRIGDTLDDASKMLLNET
jgi:hypothetical protein